MVHLETICSAEPFDGGHYVTRNAPDAELMRRVNCSPLARERSGSDEPYGARRESKSAYAALQGIEPSRKGPYCRAVRCDYWPASEACDAAAALQSSSPDSGVSQSCVDLEMC